MGVSMDRGLANGLGRVNLRGRLQRIVEAFSWFEGLSLDELGVLASRRHVDTMYSQNHHETRTENRKKFRKLSSGGFLNLPN